MTSRQQQLSKKEISLPCSATINMSIYKQALNRTEISPGNCFRFTTEDKQWLGSKARVCVSGAQRAHSN